MQLIVKKWIGRIAGVAAAVGGVQTVSAANGITGLGRPPGGTYFGFAQGVSGDGTVVVGSNGLVGDVRPFRWTAATGLQLIPGFGVESDTSAIAFAVSADGLTLVGKDENTAGQIEAFRTTAAGTVGLGFVPGFTNSSAAFGVSRDGSVIVGESQGSTVRAAFRWTAATGPVDIGRIQNSEITSAAAVSGDGNTVVGTSGTYAFRWTAATGMTALPAGPGVNPFNARGTSGDGSVVVGAGSGAGNTAYRWSAATGTVGLGDLPGGATASQANGVSENGNVVVGSSISSFGDDSFYWTPATGMRRLTDALLAAGVNPAASGWTSLNAAYAVSADGNSVAGYGMHLGRLEAFVATVPEPACAGLLAAAAAGLLRRRRTTDV